MVSSPNVLKPETINLVKKGKTLRKIPIEKVSIKIDNNKNDRRVTIEPESPIQKENPQNDFLNEKLFTLFKNSGLVNENKSIEPNTGAQIFF